MNQTGTSQIGRDVAGEQHTHAPGLPTHEERRAMIEYTDNMRKAIEDVRNPLSVTNLAKAASTAAFAVAFGYAVGGIVSLFRPKELVPATMPGK